MIGNRTPLLYISITYGTFGIESKSYGPGLFSEQGRDYKFTWRTISTWPHRHKLYGIATLQPKPRSDKRRTRKVQVGQLAEAIHEVLPTLSTNKVGQVPKVALFRQLLKKGYFTRDQLSQTTFYKMVRENELLKEEVNKKLRRSFAMKFANELWQADTMHGPRIKQANGQWRKTFLIAFIDDASRVITHAEFFYHDNTENMVDAFRKALYNEVSLSGSILIMAAIINRRRSVWRVD